MGATSQAEYIRLADRALATGRAIAGDGILAVPDMMLAEGFANGLPVPATLALQRDDGRSVSFFWLPRGWPA